MHLVHKGKGMNGILPWLPCPRFFFFLNINSLNSTLFFEDFSEGVLFFFFFFFFFFFKFNGQVLVMARGLVAPGHMGSSFLPRNQTHTPYIAGHFTGKEGPSVCTKEGIIYKERTLTARAWAKETGGPCPSRDYMCSLLKRQAQILGYKKDPR